MLSSAVRLFRIPTVSIVLAQSFLVGAIYYGNIFYVPMFFQYVMGYSAIKTGTLTLAYTLPQSLYGIASGFIISKTNWYKAVIIFGSGVWTLGAGLQIMWSPQSSLGQVIGVLQVSSIGIGCCLQSSTFASSTTASCLLQALVLTALALVAMMAVSPDKDRAVVTSSRNFFRTMGKPDLTCIADVFQVAPLVLPSPMPSSTITSAQTCPPLSLRKKQLGSLNPPSPFSAVWTKANGPESSTPTRKACGAATSSSRRAAVSVSCCRCLSRR